MIGMFETVRGRRETRNVTLVTRQTVEALNAELEHERTRRRARLRTIVNAPKLAALCDMGDITLDTDWPWPGKRRVS